MPFQHPKVSQSPVSTAILFGHEKGPLPKCRGTESNRPHKDFQSSALPTELPRQFLSMEYSTELSRETRRQEAPLYQVFSFYQALCRGRRSKNYTGTCG